MQRKMTAVDFQDFMRDLLESSDGYEVYDEDFDDDDETAAEYGTISVQEWGWLKDQYMTNDHGLWVKLDDGTKFTVTIQQVQNY